jgi:hypothetical protein
LEWWICQRSSLRGQTPHCVACTEEGSIEKPTNDERRSVNVRYRYNPSRTDAAGGCRYRWVLPDKSRHDWHLHDRVVWQLLQVKASIQQYKEKSSLIFLVRIPTYPPRQYLVLAPILDLGRIARRPSPSPTHSSNNGWFQSYNASRDIALHPSDPCLRLQPPASSANIR